MYKKVIIFTAILALGWGIAWGSDVSDTKGVEPSIERTMQLRNEVAQLSAMTFMVGDLATTFVISEINPTDPMRLWLDLKILKSRGIKELHIYIDSGGGSAFAGLSYASQLMAAWPDFKIITYAMGSVASAAIPIFLAGEYRIASVNTLFMVHEAALHKGPTMESSDDLRAQTIMIDLITSNYNNIITQRSNLTLEQILEKSRKTTWFTAQQAKEWGMVEEVQ